MFSRIVYTFTVEFTLNLLPTTSDKSGDLVKVPAIKLLEFPDN